MKHIYILLYIFSCITLISGDSPVLQRPRQLTWWEQLQVCVCSCCSEQVEVDDEDEQEHEMMRRVSQDMRDGVSQSK